MKFYTVADETYNHDLSVLLRYAHRLGYHGRVSYAGDELILALPLPNANREYVIHRETYGNAKFRTGRYGVNGYRAYRVGYNRNLESVKRSLRYYATLQRGQ